MSYTWGVTRDPRSVDRLRLDRTTARDDADRDPVHLRRLAVELAPMVRVWERLIDQHTPNRFGCCRTCTTGGTGSSSTPWPCSLYGIAEMARRRHARDLREA
jgi:hypothetical protein